MSQPESGFSSYDLVCLSHLRWKFVFQRPQHLLTRCAAERRVFFFEEPIFEGIPTPRLQLEEHGKVTVATPCVPHGMAGAELLVAQRQLLDELIRSRSIRQYVLWYYTPMALGFSDHLAPQAIVYDCMDELSAFKFAPAELKQREAELLRRAAVVFTGGQSLYEAKRDAHPNIHPFPSSVDVAHFGQARRATLEPEDQRPIPHPRLGFFGVIDERMDLELLRGVAAARPDWHLVLLGPVVKIDAAALPQAPNIHYLGAKQYAGVAGLHRLVGRRLAAVCAQRVDPLHQPDQDT